MDYPDGRAHGQQAQPVGRLIGPEFIQPPAHGQPVQQQAQQLHQPNPEQHQPDGRHQIVVKTPHIGALRGVAVAGGFGLHLPPVPAPGHNAHHNQRKGNGKLGQGRAGGIAQQAAQNIAEQQRGGGDSHAGAEKGGGVEVETAQGCRAFPAVAPDELLPRLPVQPPDKQPHQQRWDAAAQHFAPDGRTDAPFVEVELLQQIAEGRLQNQRAAAQNHRQPRQPECRLEEAADCAGPARLLAGVAVSGQVAQQPPGQAAANHSHHQRIAALPVGGGQPETRFAAQNQADRLKEQPVEMDSGQHQRIGPDGVVGQFAHGGGALLPAVQQTAHKIPVDDEQGRRHEQCAGAAGDGVAQVVRTADADLIAQGDKNVGQHPHQIVHRSQNYPQADSYDQIEIETTNESQTVGLVCLHRRIGAHRATPFGKRMLKYAQLK